MRFTFKPLSAALFLVLANVSAFALNQFDGYLRNTKDYCEDFVATATITVYTVSHANATGLTDCSGTPITGNVVSGSSYRFCFKGPDAAYDLDVDLPGTDADFHARWITSTNHIPGVYYLTEFGADPTSVDNLYSLKSALAYIGSRVEAPNSGGVVNQGGVLNIPNGNFDLSYVAGRGFFSSSLPAVLPPGITVIGTGAKNNYAASRLQIGDEGGNIFKITGCSDNVTVRDLQLLAYGAPDYVVGSTAILATGGAGDGPSNNVRFQGLTTQGFEQGIHVYATDQSWQFGTSHVEDSLLTGIYPVHLQSYNAEMELSHVSLHAGTSADFSVRGSGLWIEESSFVNMNYVYGAGNPVTPRNHRSFAFLLITGPHGTVKLTHCNSENIDRAISYQFSNPSFGDQQSPLVLDSCAFADPIIIKENLIFVSTGNTYASNTVQVWNTDHDSSHDGNSHKTQIYSTGDNFWAYSIVPSGFDDYDNLPHACPSSPNPLGRPTESVLERCRRDFYVYNNNTTDRNRVVVRTAQLPSASSSESESINTTHFQSGITISSPPVYNATPVAGDTFQSWGYRIERNPSTYALDFIGNQHSPNFTSSYNSLFTFNGGVYPSVDNSFDLGNGTYRWKLVRGVTVTSGDTILTDKESGRELYKIHEDDNHIYFTDIRTGKEMMRLDRQGNLFIPGRIVQGGVSLAPRVRRHRTSRQRSRH